MRVCQMLAVAACGCALTLGRSGHAEEPDDATRTAARALGGAGVAAFQGGNFAAASDKLEKAYALLKVPSLGLWSARALVKRGLLVEAAERYLEATNLQAPSGDSTVQKKAQADARTELAALRPKIPSVVVKLVDADPTQVTVMLDGEQLASSWLGRARLVNPGAHRVVAQRGSDQTDGSTTVAEGESKTLELGFSTSPAAATATAAAPTSGDGDEPGAGSPGPASSADSAPSSTKRTLAWVALGAGAAGLAVGGVTGLLAAGKKSDLKNSGACVADRCGSSQTDTVNSLNSLRTISGVAFVAGGVLAGTGIVLLLNSGSSSGSTQAFLSPTWVGLRRTF